MKKGTLTYEGIVGLMTKGKNTKQIAFAYGVSEKTVANFKWKNGITKETVGRIGGSSLLTKSIGGKKDRSEVAKQAWITRRANQFGKVNAVKEVVNTDGLVANPLKIEIGNVLVEIHGSMVEKVLPMPNGFKIVTK